MVPVLKGARLDRSGEKQQRAVPVCQGAQGDYGRRCASFSRLSRHADLGANLLSGRSALQECQSRELSEVLGVDPAQVMSNEALVSSRSVFERVQED